eukprot:gene3945-14022_t
MVQNCRVHTKGDKSKLRTKVVDKEVKFWKTELEKVCKEKNEWISHSASVAYECPPHIDTRVVRSISLLGALRWATLLSQRQNEILCAELFLLQQSEASAKAQLALAKKHLTDAKTRAVTAESEAAIAAAAQAEAEHRHLLTPPSASSQLVLHGEASRRTTGSSIGHLTSGGGYSQASSTISQYQPPGCDSDGEGAPILAAQAVGYEDQLEQLVLQIEELQNQLRLEKARLEKARSNAHSHEATLLRHQLNAQCGINDETADEITHVLQELSRLQQTNARLVSEMGLKNQLHDLSHLHSSAQNSMDSVSLVRFSRRSSHSNQGGLQGVLEEDVEEYPGDGLSLGSRISSGRYIGSIDMDAEGTDGVLLSSSSEMHSCVRVPFLPGEEAAVRASDPQNSNNSFGFPHTAEEGDSVTMSQASSGGSPLWAQQMPEEEVGPILTPRLQQASDDNLPLTPCSELGGQPGSEMASPEPMDGQASDNSPAPNHRHGALCRSHEVFDVEVHSDQSSSEKLEGSDEGGGDMFQSRATSASRDVTVSPFSRTAESRAEPESPWPSFSPTITSRQTEVVESPQRSASPTAHHSSHAPDCTDSHPENDPTCDDQTDHDASEQDSTGDNQTEQDLTGNGQAEQGPTDSTENRPAEHDLSEHEPTNDTPALGVATHNGTIVEESGDVATQQGTTVEESSDVATDQGTTQDAATREGTTGEEPSVPSSSQHATNTATRRRLSASASISGASASAAVASSAARLYRRPSAGAAYKSDAHAKALSNADAAASLTLDYDQLLSAENLSSPSTAAMAFNAARAVALAAAGEMTTLPKPLLPKPKPKHIGGDVSNILERFKTVMATTSPASHGPNRGCGHGSETNADCHAEVPDPKSSMGTAR